ncbi:MAG: hydroxymethylglutaryl-CoA reductase, degradative [Candidatus Thermoplasmatota archaeon]|nr:hydroxymethylglutaryl-CoA reductase, degradative [Candidatus Thermoplasmatota archaeon]
MERTSRIAGYYKMPPAERLKILQEFAGLSDEEAQFLIGQDLTMEQADRMIENVVGTFSLPIGIATNFLISGKETLIPFATEEPSVVAAASNAAKMARKKGGFTTSNTGTKMIGQIQIVNSPDPQKAVEDINAHKDKLLALANDQDPILVKFGGGATDMEARVVDTPAGKMVVLHIIVDTKDAMGANAVNTMAEALAPMAEELTGGKVLLRILSNLAIHRLVRSKAVFDKESLGGEEVVDRIIMAYALAYSDPFRASTHNKGIMNGISAVVRATGNDTRAVEAGAHAYAARDGTYRSLTRYSKDENGDLIGEIELPMAVGLVGGATKVHPAAKACVKVLDVKTAVELGEIIAAVGLAQNLGALRALTTEGIQKGHMGLHARNIAVQAGATGDEVDKVASKLVEMGKVREDLARQILQEIRGG